MKRIALALALAATLACAAPAVYAGAQQTIAHWSLALAKPGNVAAGKTFDVQLAVSIESGWHLYALSEPPGGPPPLGLGVAAGSPFSLGGPIIEPEPKHALDPNFPDPASGSPFETSFHEGLATFSMTVKVAAGTKSGWYKLKIESSYVTCSDRLCLPPRTDVTTIDVGVGDAGPLVAPTPAAATTAPGAKGPTEPTATQPAGGIVPPDAPVVTSLDPPVTRIVDMAAASTASTLGAYVALAALMGALSLLTPCVFPMVPITVSYFTNRAGRSRREAVTQALIYGAGIILTFTGLGFTLALVFGASGLNQFAANPWLNIGVTLLFIGFAASLFGVYELALPSSVVTAAAKADAGKGRYVGTLLMGLAFTLTSFTCTAPFLGTLLVVASQGDWQWPLAGMLAFSGVFALPFVILALAPQYIAALPRSGAWLIAVKATMGLLELAAAMKFISNVDLVWHWGIFTRPVVLVVWTVIAGVMVAYLMGLIALGHAPRLKRPGAVRFITAVAALVLAVWLGMGLGGKRLGELEAFLPPADLGGKTQGKELAWRLNDFDAALAEAKSKNIPLVVDFTGYTCTNCRWMEANMFPRPEVEIELQRYARARLYTDDGSVLNQKHQAMEQKVFGTVALPLYAIYSPDGKPVVMFGGLTRNSPEFVAFLRKGLE